MPTATLCPSSGRSRASGLIVDPGVFEYIAGPRRAASRSAATHNTLCYDGLDQAEFFGAFRCGRRPKVTVLAFDADDFHLVLKGTHNGFGAAARHERQFEVEPGRLRIVDVFDPPCGRPARLGFLLHPEAVVGRAGDRLLIVRGRARVEMRCDATITVEDAVWWPDMGVETADAACQRRAGRRASPRRYNFHIASGRGVRKTGALPPCALPEVAVKQVQQNYRSGELKLVEVPAPGARDGELLVATRVSLISAGTERQLIELAKSSLVGKAAARPDLVRRVLANVRREGLRPTLDKVFAKLDTPIPLGYSLVGEVIGIGCGVDGYSLGDRVACAGAGLANHAEINATPKNLTVPVPPGVDDEDASFVTLGAIALQGVRLAAPTLGETVVVIGLGLIGLLTTQILKANGCRVIGFDPKPERVALAKDLGADVALSEFAPRGGGEPNTRLRRRRSDRHRVVEVERARQHGGARSVAMKGRVVVVGLVGLTIDRERLLQARARAEVVDVLRARPRRPVLRDQPAVTIRCLMCAGPSSATWRRSST